MKIIRRKTVSAIIISMLIIYLLATSAMALTTYSTATINIGSIYVQGAHNYLNDYYLFGRVKSTDGSAGAQLYGGMLTYDFFGPFVRGYAYVDVGETSATYYWDSNETGYYFAEVYASGKNHNGDSKAWQSGH